jgi:CHAD domain-containing protein
VTAAYGTKDNAGISGKPRSVPVSRRPAASTQGAAIQPVGRRRVLRDAGIAGHRSQRPAPLTGHRGRFADYGCAVVSEYLEVERKYDVDASFRSPAPADLAGLSGVATVEEPVEHLLEAAYFDTPDLRLFQGRVTLRRRTGGADAGWHLKLPAGAGARRELHAPLGRAVKKPPRTLLDPVTGLLRGVPVGPVADLRTRRVVTLLRDADGRVLAELADDTVTATVPSTTPAEPVEAQTWREVEVELVDGDESLLAAVGELLVAAGARPSAHPSKFGHAVAGRLAALQPAPATGDRGPRAGDLVLDAVRAQVTALQAGDVLLRTGQPEAVHSIRIAARRLRSILSDFRAVLDREATDPVRAELAWLGGELSTARDEEVALAHLRDLVDAEPPELLLGPVAARLRTTQLKAEQDGRKRGLATLSDARYLRLLDTLYALLADPPFADRAADGPRRAVRRAVRRSARRMDRRLAAAAGADGEARDEALHEVRKAAKRLRYTAEAAGDRLGRPGTKVVKVAKKAQTELGARQDTVVTRELCRRLAVAASAAGESAFPYGRLHALEQARAERAAADFAALEPRLHPLLTKLTRSS